MRTEILISSKDITLARIGQIGVLICRGTITQKTTAGIVPLIEDLAQQYPVGIALLTLVEHGSKPPDSEMRHQMAEILKMHHAHLKCAAVVVEGQGFLPALVRSVTTGLALIARTSFPYEVVSLQNLGSFFSQSLSDFSEEEFKKSLEQIRAETQSPT